MGYKHVISQIDCSLGLRKSYFITHMQFFSQLVLLPHLCEQPRVLFRQSVKVGLGRHVGIAESVLDSCRRADVLVEELLSCLLGDGFGRHDCLG